MRTWGLPDSSENSIEPASTLPVVSDRLHLRPIGCRGRALAETKKPRRSGALQRNPDAAVAARDHFFLAAAAGAAAAVLAGAALPPLPLGAAAAAAAAA